jgi:hypothetical protein
MLPKTTLFLHHGTNVATIDEISQVPTPPPTETWFPLAHRRFIDETAEQLNACGFVITESVHALSHSGDRYFGIQCIRLMDDPTPKTDYTWVVGLRNSHDKSFPAGLVAGTRVFVCDNLAFNGEVRVARKHTRFAARDIREMTARAVSQLGENLRRIDLRIAAYRGKNLEDGEAHDLIVRAIDCRAITNAQMPAVLNEWRNPRHEEFRPRTAWSLFNAVTESHKPLNPHCALRRGEALHGLFDRFLGLN